MRIKEFVQRYGQPYSEILNIRVDSGNNREIVKWFLAALLYSKPIRESSASKTYRSFEKRGFLSGEAIIKAGWDKLVAVLDEGGYTRYDFSTADKLLEVFKNLKHLYGGDLTNLYRSSKNSGDLERRLKALGKGIGDITISIFLRDLQRIWKKADPKPAPLVESAMKSLGINDLGEFARKNRVNVIWLETALLRYSKGFLKKGKTLPLSF
ncbi:hypothetical protein [[Eubacterium] cellulosolvens]